MGSDAGSELTSEQRDVLLELLELPASARTGPTAMLDIAAAQVAACLGDGCIVSLVSRDERRLVPRAVADPRPEGTELLESLTAANLRADRGFTRQVLDTARSLRLSETSPEVVAVGRPELADYARRFATRSVIVAPMRVAGRAIGHVATLRGRGSPYTPADERFVQAVADILALAVRAVGAPRRAAAAPEDATTTADLTTREREILTLLGLGHTNREIAATVHLSVRTVEWHRGRLQSKLGVRGRAALQQIARSDGLIDVLPP
jgi:DNA-binding NarL/FixJ family response regulator